MLAILEDPAAISMLHTVLNLAFVNRVVDLGHNTADTVVTTLVFSKGANEILLAQSKLGLVAEVELIEFSRRDHVRSLLVDGLN